MKKIIFLMGPTTSGKTKLSIELNKHIPIEIISVDSAAVYRNMDIGTDKPSKKIRNLVKHYLIDIKDPSEYYSVNNFRKDASLNIKKILKKKKYPLLVGGSMFYFKSLLYGLNKLPPKNVLIREKIKKLLLNGNNLHYELYKIDPESSKLIHKNDFKRIERALEIFFVSGKTLTEIKKKKKNILPYQVCIFAIMPDDKRLLFNNIEKRLNKMLFLGFEDEVKKLFNRNDLNINLPSMQCIGYKQMWEYFSGYSNYENMIEKIKIATKKLIKRQITWIRNWENINFIKGKILSTDISIILKKIE